MVPKVLTAWRWQRGPGAIVLYPRDGSSSTMQIRTRISPLRTAPEIATLLIQELGLEPPKRISPFELYATVEGEYGAFVDLASASRDGRAVDVSLAILFGDDWYTCIIGISSPEHTEAVRASVRELGATYALGLGELRRRRFRYEAPAGWTNSTRGLIDEWHHGPSSISVFPARPLKETAAGAIDRALHELVIDGFVATVDQHVPLNTGRFTKGIARLVTGTRDGTVVHHDVAILQDERFFYVARLESSAEALAANRVAFTKLVDSIEPLPQPQHESNAVDPALAASWVD
jgi:hypothetical protein